MTARTILRTRTGTMVLAVLLLLALSVGIATAQQDTMAQIRVVHAVPDADAVDVYVDGELAIEALAYTEATDFQELPEGDHDIAIVPAGGDVAEPLAETSISVSAGDVLTLVARGMADSIEILEVPHDWEPPAEGMARLVLVNATADAADVALLQEGQPIVGEGPVPAGEVATGEIAPGVYNFEVQVGGEPATTIDGFTVEADSTYSIFVMGTAGSYQAVPYEDMVAAGAAPGDGTPEGTPDADATPAADMTGTPEEDMTPEADMTGTPEEDMTPEADMTGTPEEDMTPAVGGGVPGDETATAEADMTRTAAAGDMTPSPGAPGVPATGAGGSAGDSGASGWIAMALAALAIALGGGLVWRARNDRPAA